MLISEALAQARSEYQVYFLVTAYLENLQHRSEHVAWPAYLVSLPILGADDLARRRGIADAVIAMFHHREDGVHGVIGECHEIFTQALERLASLEAQHASLVAASPVQPLPSVHP